MLSLLAALVAAATPPAEIDPEALRRHVAVLASDAFEGRMPGTRGEARTIAYVADQFEKAGLAPAAGGERWYQPVPLGSMADPNRMSHNVIGRIAGTDPGAGTIVVMAHWDHLGLCRPEGAKDRICNGAVDNASGVAELIELARMLAAGPRPARTILFLATTGEESGQRGAHAFLRSPPVPPGSIRAAVNLDCVAIGPRGGPLGVVGRGLTRLDPLIDRVAAETGRIVAPGRAANEYVGRQDGSAFLAAGIPAVMVGSAYGNLRWLHAFMLTRYHHPDDENGLRLDLRGAGQDGAFLAAFVRALADPGRFPDPR